MPPKRDIYDPRNLDPAFRRGEHSGQFVIRRMADNGAGEVKPYYFRRMGGGYGWSLDLRGAKVYKLEAAASRVVREYGGEVIMLPLEKEPARGAPSISEEDTRELLASLAEMSKKRGWGEIPVWLLETAGSGKAGSRGAAFFSLFRNVLCDWYDSLERKEREA